MKKYFNSITFFLITWYFSTCTFSIVYSYSIFSSNLTAPNYFFILIVLIFIIEITVIKHLIEYRKYVQIAIMFLELETLISEDTNDNRRIK